MCTLYLTDTRMYVSWLRLLNLDVAQTSNALVCLPLSPEETLLLSLVSPYFPFAALLVIALVHVLSVRVRACMRCGPAPPIFAPDRPLQRPYAACARPSVCRVMFVSFLRAALPHRCCHGSARTRSYQARTSSRRLTTAGCRWPPTPARSRRSISSR